MKLELREKYPNFIYRDYVIESTNETISITYFFEIENLEKFEHKIEINSKFIRKDINEQILNNLVFNLGLVEVISYIKSCFCKNLIIKCGAIDKYQEKWFKKLYFLGLGELRYLNKIEITENEIVNFISEGKEIKYDESSEIFENNIIPIGGGKDSNVTLGILNPDTKKDLAFIINPKKITMECAKIAGFEDDNILKITRKIDNRLIELVKKGFINGHVPFSAVLSFIAYIAGYLTKRKYIVLSNESSANESNVVGEQINHQYSKTLEYELDFDEYSQRYLKQPVKYFSLLRPLNELQIAKIFSKFKEYHSTFKSCNVGSKTEPWKWCSNCPKCLFVYIILSPFLSKKELIEIFGEDLFENKDLLNTFNELLGRSDNKPFECVGTYEEVNFAVNKTIEKSDLNNLPYLLKYYKENYGLMNFEEDITKRFESKHNLPEEFERIVKEVLYSDQ